MPVFVVSLSFEYRPNLFLTDRKRPFFLATERIVDNMLSFYACTSTEPDFARGILGLIQGVPHRTDWVPKQL